MGRSLNDYVNIFGDSTPPGATNSHYNKKVRNAQKTIFAK